ncbi:uncharacterized [Tachysurus ichikawai]
MNIPPSDPIQELVSQCSSCSRKGHQCLTRHCTAKADAATNAAAKLPEQKQNTNIMTKLTSSVLDVTELQGMSDHEETQCWRKL